MADFVHKYPYTDLENMNLDWILENETKQNEIIDAVAENDKKQDAEIANIKEDITTINGDIAGINSRLDEVDDNIGDLVEQDTHLEGLVNTANNNAQNAIDRAAQANNNASSAYNAVNTLQSKHNSDVARLEAQISSISGGVVPEFYKPNILFNTEDFASEYLLTRETTTFGTIPYGAGILREVASTNSAFELVSGEGLKPRANNLNQWAFPIYDRVFQSVNADNPITITFDTNQGVHSITYPTSTTMSFNNSEFSFSMSNLTNETIQGLTFLKENVQALVIRSRTIDASLRIRAIKVEYSSYFTGFSPMPFAEYLRSYWNVTNVTSAIADATAITESAITGGDIRFGFYRRPAEATEETQPIYWTCKGYYVRQFNEVNVHLDVCYANYTDTYAVVVDSPIYEIAGDLVLGDGVNKFILPRPKSELLPAYSLVSCYGVPVQTSLDTIVNDLVKSWVSINLSGECYLFTVIKPGALLYNQDSPGNTNPGAPTFTYDFNYICR